MVGRPGLEPRQSLRICDTRIGLDVDAGQDLLHGYLDPVIALDIVRSSEYSGERNGVLCE